VDEYQSENYQQTMMSHARCMVCGTHNPDSLGIRFYQGEEGTTEGLFIADQRHQGYSDILHGGMTSTLLDAVMTHALLASVGGMIVAKASAKFIKPKANDRS
jgi:acyl-coenzyme A thioesterase PaaI-like protein